MSQQAFQSLLFRMIAEPAFRDGVRAQKPFPPRIELTEREHRRLRRLADDPGLDINRTLHKGFRLGKLRALLPMTCQLLGARRLSRELSRFWIERPPSSFSFLPEALDFCDYLKRRRLRMRYLPDILAYECTVLELEQAGQAMPGAIEQRNVSFEYDPGTLLSALVRGERPGDLPPHATHASATRLPDGRIRWHLQIERGVSRPPASPPGPAG
ncbi:hypothetical protein H4F99_03425 [Lysobacter sp. SG-8]|uniref:Uncharacterized protein n=1 Tax=Marilutibacter penaei TaxID=2759900 RepID=A0A7W3U2Q2_9GAMM|nr:hypothetical protein [Lysobacter penaei]MBB1087535.1 hypothetical protein [Lysobacter penaei]